MLAFLAPKGHSTSIPALNISVRIHIIKDMMVHIADFCLVILQMIKKENRSKIIEFEKQIKYNHYINK